MIPSAETYDPGPLRRRPWRRPRGPLAIPEWRRVVRSTRRLKFAIV